MELVKETPTILSVLVFMFWSKNNRTDPPFKFVRALADLEFKRETTEKMLLEFEPT